MQWKVDRFWPVTIFKFCNVKKYISRYNKIIDNTWAVIGYARYFAFCICIVSTIYNMYWKVLKY